MQLGVEPNRNLIHFLTALISTTGIGDMDPFLAFVFV